ncbi:hypothetical protein GTHT12_03700 (plasmid) [Geobacillus thermodenitrificans]|uniref:PqqD family protein n=1 Tax=Geobacillus thermodenitrificans TaxID=33940 RepID=UPI000A296E92|nr:PqqD family protein [Geobacillus thermodenitrificans]ARP44569.1 hypothetical protein GTHT12_03700 [Geobacillus thermodenitrificans]
MKNDVYYYSDNIKFFNAKDGIGIHNFDNDRYYYLEGTSLYIWFMLDGTTSVGEIIESINNNCKNISNTVDVEKEVMQFLNQLVSDGLIVKVR